MLRLILVSAVGLGALAMAPQPLAGAVAAGSESADEVCKYVVSAERGSKPYQLCMSKAEWAAKAAKDAKDPNRIECRYEDVPGTKLKGRKICQPASQWAEDKQLYREQVEDMQMSVCVPGAGC